ncbi:cyclase/dehydrase [Polynucleobacter sp. IMCC30063]|uniref:SRPBCC family protein n=1 Tax=Polynucleobacter sp. IMCC30063 TaxID=2907298 RepID=UPI001F37B3AA|nr:SRPBCC family protein [Polynucleobacter sp. IMCC30063]MCE7506230.1 cyclase/dehydrase [Polynucleobacter sp. IMCC30063]
MHLKLFSFFAATFFLISSHAQDSTNPYDVKVTVTSLGGRLQISATYAVPVNMCSAYTFLTDYEASKNIPGIVDAQIISRTANKVRVYRAIEEEILFFQVELKSLVEYTETPYQLISFEQISGDAKFYKGTWRLVSEKAKTVFKYDSLVELDSVVPSFVIAYFIKNNIRSRLEAMAKKATQHKIVDMANCK